MLKDGARKTKSKQFLGETILKSLAQYSWTWIVWFVSD